MQTIKTLLKPTALLYSIRDEELQKLPGLAEVQAMDYSEFLTRNLRLQRMVGSILIYLIVTLCLFVFCLNSISYLSLKVGSTAIITIPAMLLLLVSFMIIITRSGLPMRFFGFTLRNWQQSLFEGILYSLPIMALIALVKWVMITYIPDLYGYKLFNLGADVRIPNLQDHHLFLLLPLLYIVLSTPVQEIIFRGGLQGILQSFLLGKYRNFIAIFASNLVFGTMHLISSSEGFVIITFALGMFWGWLYQRQRSLVGVIASHILIGAWAFFIVGIKIIITSLDLIP